MKIPEMSRFLFSFSPWKRDPRPDRTVCFFRSCAQPSAAHLRDQ
jgi:hypothetical protein